jgi:hypothetical protein
VNVIMLAMPAAPTGVVVMAIVTIIIAAARHPRRRSRYRPSLWDPAGDVRASDKPEPDTLIRGIWDPPPPQGRVLQSAHPPLAWGRA